jgi:hypothetical protein
MADYPFNGKYQLPITKCSNPTSDSSSSAALRPLELAPCRFFPHRFPRSQQAPVTLGFYGRITRSFEKEIFSHQPQCHDYKFTVGTPVPLKMTFDTDTYTILDHRISNGWSYHQDYHLRRPFKRHGWDSVSYRGLTSFMQGSFVNFDERGVRHQP